MARSSVRLKLLIDTHGKRVVLAEAGKDFVDFLCQIFVLPFATVFNLLQQRGTVGSLTNLYESIENLNASCIEPKTKNKVLKPVTKVSCGVFSPISEMIGHNGKCVYDGSDGFVKGITYMVTDDLIVTPLSTISSIGLLYEFGFDNLGELEEKDVVLGINEGLELLRASISQSKNVLTHVFLSGLATS